MKPGFRKVRWLDQDHLTWDICHMKRNSSCQPCKENPGIWKCSHRPKWAFSSKTFPPTLHGRIFHRLWSECYLNSSLPFLPGKVQKGSLRGVKKSDPPSLVSFHAIHSRFFWCSLWLHRKGKRSKMYLFVSSEENPKCYSSYLKWASLSGSD